MMASTWTTLSAVRVESSPLAQYEEADWRSLHDEGRSLEAKFDNMIEEYVQETSIQQSRSVGRLTALATILVPCSIIAGIFSMSDEYLVGKKLFWVFWAVALPVVGIFALAVFTTVISSLWRWASGFQERRSRVYEMP